VKHQSSHGGQKDSQQPPSLDADAGRPGPQPLHGKVDGDKEEELEPDLAHGSWQLSVFSFRASVVNLEPPATWPGFSAFTPRLRTSAVMREPRSTARSGLTAEARRRAE